MANNCFWSHCNLRYISHRFLSNFCIHISIAFTFSSEYIAPFGGPNTTAWNEIRPIVQWWTVISVMFVVSFVKNCTIRWIKSTVMRTASGCVYTVCTLKNRHTSIVFTCFFLFLFYNECRIMILVVAYFKCNIGTNTNCFFASFYRNVVFVACGLCVPEGNIE